MNRSQFLRLSGAGLAASTLGSCASPAVSGVPVAWPPTTFDTMRAFVYDCDSDSSVGFFQQNGAVTRGVINAPGVLLSATQVQRLLPVLTTETRRTHRTACYVPHHAFVFYNKSGQAVAHSELCFNCSVQRGAPEGLPANIDFQAVWDLLRELGIPCGDGSQFYRDLFKAKSAAPPLA